MSFVLLNLAARRIGVILFGLAFACGAACTERTSVGGTGAATAGSNVPATALPGSREALRRGNVVSPLITEASGMVASKRNPGVLWVHNDSGDLPRLFAMRDDGTTLGIFRLPGAVAIDWEDIALHDGALYVADFGDNEEERPFVSIYRVPEPIVGDTPLAATAVLESAEVIELIYPDRPHDAETLLVDPVSGDLYVISKARTGLTMVYRSPAPLSPGTRKTMEHVTTLEFDTPSLPGSRMVTAGDTSPSGDAVLLKTYSHAYLWPRTAGEPLWKAFRAAPIPVSLEAEPQGEAICFDADGRGYFTVSEGLNPPLFYFPRMD